MNSHETQTLGLAVITAWAILSAEGIRGRLLTVLTILASMAGGLGVGFAIGNTVIRDNAAISWMILLGAVSGILCIVRNRQSRTRRRIAPSNLK